MTLSNAPAPTPSQGLGEGTGNTPRKPVPDFSIGFDIYRLDCAVEALREAEITDPEDRAELQRIRDNLNDLIEARQ